MNNFLQAPISVALRDLIDQLLFYSHRRQKQILEPTQEAVSSGIPREIKREPEALGRLHASEKIFY